MIKYQELTEKIDWSDLLQENDIDKANYIFEERIRGILDNLSPVKNLPDKKQKQELD